MYVKLWTQQLEHMKFFQQTWVIQQIGTNQAWKKISTNTRIDLNTINSKTRK